jgi:Na+-transporting NADH:ubiquinone oxidoreductase subunit A
MIQIRQGLDLPIAGSPRQDVGDGLAIRTVAIVGNDYHDLKPTMAVQVGDSVKLGQTLFTDKKFPRIRYTAPGAGKIAAIHRGARRVLQSVVIDLEGDAAETFQQFEVASFGTLDREQVVENLLNAGLWTALRTRPYSKVPNPDSKPHAIFVTAIDTNPLAANPQAIIEKHAAEFIQGLQLLSRLTAGKVHVCMRSGASVKGLQDNEHVQAHQFAGPHPAGNAGTHIHCIDPVSATKTVWTIGYQDVIAIAKLFATGRLSVERIISLAGPQVDNPRLIKTRLGANVQELTAGLLRDGDNRIISGSVFGGRNAYGPFAYLGRYHTQVSVLLEGNERPFLHYLQAGNNRFSALPIYLSSLFKHKLFQFTTSTNGSERAMVPVGSYEKVMPLDILPTQLLRALIVGDTETAQALGCLELDEEDLALCTFVCPGKYEYGPILRDNLSKIEREG